MYLNCYMFTLTVKVGRILTTITNIITYVPLGLCAEISISDLIASSSFPHVGAGTTLSHIINISLQASTARLWSLLMLAMSKSCNPNSAPRVSQ